MKKASLLLFALAFLSVATPRLHAQGGTIGCPSSPENPTAVLAVVGSAGAFFASTRRRIKSRRSAK